MPKLTPREAALAQLVNFGVPVPQDVIVNFDPQGRRLEFFSGLFYLQDLTDALLKRAVEFFGEMDQSGDEVDDTASDVINRLTHCLASAMMALVSLGLLPQEAEDAMVEAASG